MDGCAVSRRLAESIRGYRIRPARPWKDERDRGAADPEERARRAALRKQENEWAMEHGLALVMLQEQELDDDGHREQSAEAPDWRVVEKFARQQREESKA